MTIFNCLGFGRKPQHQSPSATQPSSAGASSQGCVLPAVPMPTYPSGTSQKSGHIEDPQNIIDTFDRRCFNTSVERHIPTRVVSMQADPTDKSLLFSPLGQPYLASKNMSSKDLSLHGLGSPPPTPRKRHVTLKSQNADQTSSVIPKQSYFVEGDLYHVTSLSAEQKGEYDVHSPRSRPFSEARSDRQRSPSSSRGGERKRPVARIFEREEIAKLLALGDLEQQAHAATKVEPSASATDSDRCGRRTSVGTFGLAESFANYGLDHDQIASSQQDSGAFRGSPSRHVNSSQSAYYDHDDMPSASNISAGSPRSRITTCSSEYAQYSPQAGETDRQTLY